ncbi:MAG TPA: glycosyl hydrolase, partial [Calditrichia bacterium]|nr:glycosyl hydrolase [Calditrichia bacterium]
PFGGPQVNPGQASKYLAHRTYRLSGGQRLQEAIRYRQEALVRTVGPIDGVEIREPISANPNLQALALDQVRFEKDLPLQVVMAFSDAGDKLDLTTRVDSSGHLDWVAPAGQWTLYALFQGWHGKMVERAAPGGEGYTIDHFSKTALSQYLSRFDQAFAGHNLSGLRAFFNDSYEVDDAFGNSDWTPAFFDEFEARRGYDLRNFLPALLGEGRDETHQRVLSDYRETLSDLIREMFTETWRRWAAGRGVMVRNQAHGSPGNVLDLYAASDIPETEGTRILTMKFASSAANVSGKPLVGAEAATWLDEHFRTTLAKVKENLDRFFLGGVNHVVYHGTAYSPQADEWPGRLFYAAVHFNPRNSWWEDLAALNAYVSRTQAFLQSGRPDNDILLYFPIHDRFAEPGRETLEHFGGRGGFRTSAFRALADTLQSLGYTFDYLSDRQLGNLSVADRRLRSGGNTYRAILVPQSRFMPLASFRKLRALARSGATVLFQNSLPEDVPGLGDLEARREQFKKLHKRIVFSETDRKGVQWAGLNFGAFLIGADVQQLLNFCRIPRETLPENGLAFVRRRDANGPFYFIANQGETPVEQWVDFQANGQAAAIFEPMRKNFGLVRFEPIDGRSRVYLQLQPGESCIVKMFESEPTGPAFPYLEADGEPVALDGDWEVRFVAGG